MKQLQNSRGVFICLVGAMLLLSSTVYGDKKQKVLTPESVPGITTIIAFDLVQMLTSSSDLLVIDARIPTARAKGFIETSIHLPDIETNCDSLKKVISSFDKTTVFYCGSKSCGRSLNSVKIAQQCGYKNLYWFRGGFKEWKASGLPYVK